jgi:hypothetical protein
MNGHAYSRAAVEWIFTPWRKPSKREMQNALLLKY